MPTLLDKPLAAMLETPEQAKDASPVVEAFVARIAKAAFAAAMDAPQAAVTEAVASTSNISLVAAFAELLALETEIDATVLALLRGRVALAKLLERSGGVWSVEDATSRLSVSRMTLQNWRDQKKVIALQHKDRSFVYPAAQFQPAASDLSEPRPLPGIARVLARVGDAWTPEELVAMLASPQEMLADAEGNARTGFELLASGDPDATNKVLGAIDHAITPADAGAPND